MSVCELCVCLCVCVHALSCLGYVCVLSCLVVSHSLQPHGLQPARLLCPLNFPGKNTGVGCHAFFQGIFQTQGSNPGLLYLSCMGRWVLYQWCHLGSPMAFAAAQKSTRYCHPPPPTSGVLTCHSSDSSVKGHVGRMPLR